MEQNNNNNSYYNNNALLNQIIFNVVGFRNLGAFNEARVQIQTCTMVPNSHGPLFLWMLKTLLNPFKLEKYLIRKDKSFFTWG